MTSSTTTVRPELAELEVPIDSVHPHPRNARRGDVGRLTESLHEHGQYRPIVVRRATAEILAGNHTWAAAKKLGWPTIAVTFVDCDDETATRILLADNRYAELGTFDDEALLELLRDLAGTDAGLTATGYTEADLSDLLDGIDGHDATALNDPDALPERAPAITALGDIWILGEHRVICGSAADGADHQALLGDEEVACLFTDPPYGVSYVGGTDEALTLEGDDLDPEQLHQLVRDALVEGGRRLRKGGAAYVCFAEGNGDLFRRAYRDAGLLLKQTLVWVKNTFVVGRQDYQWQHEPILYGWKPGAAHHWHGGRTRSTVLDDEVALDGLRKAELVAMLEEIRSLSTVLREDKPARSKDHPTMKPVRLVTRCISPSSRKGEIVLDPFAGAGSTLIACHQTGRIARLIELDPRYVDVICRRYQEHTGTVPVLERTGEHVDFTTDG